MAARVRQGFPPDAVAKIKNSQALRSNGLGLLRLSFMCSKCKQRFCYCLSLTQIVGLANHATRPRAGTRNRRVEAAVTQPGDHARAPANTDYLFQRRVLRQLISDARLTRVSGQSGETRHNHARCTSQGILTRAAGNETMQKRHLWDSNPRGETPSA